jgi:hypothetical protein
MPDLANSSRHIRQNLTPQRSLQGFGQISKDGLTVGELNKREIGELMGVDYNLVSRFRSPLNFPPFSQNSNGERTASGFFQENNA